MAGDWIKMRTDLDEDPSVIGIALATGLEEDVVVGKLWKLWKWANQQTRDGNAVGVSEKWVDRYLRVDGFSAAMAKFGWLVVSEDGINFPNFDRHNGKSAKERALTAKRVARHAAKNTNGDLTVAPLPREEKRRDNTAAEKPPRANRSGKARTPPENGTAPTPPDTPPAKERPRNHLFDAIVEVTREDPSLNGALIGRCCKALLAADPPYTPDDVRALPAAIAALGWSFAVTVPVVMKHIGLTRATPTVPGKNAQPEGPTPMEQMRRRREEDAEVAARAVPPPGRRKPADD